jgi:hypothetical protein
MARDVAYELWLSRPVLWNAREWEPGLPWSA